MTSATSQKILKISRKEGAVLIPECKVANGFFSRLLGLLGRSTLEDGQGLLLTDCRDIHMWGMRFPIDAVFLKRTGGGWEVSSVRERLSPWKFLPARDGQADDTLEVKGGMVSRWNLRKGDRLCSA